MTAAVFKQRSRTATPKSATDGMRKLVERERKRLLDAGADPERMKRWTPSNRLANALYREHCANLDAAREKSGVRRG
jgi:hypothetical protein